MRSIHARFPYSKCACLWWHGTAVAFLNLSLVSPLQKLAGFQEEIRLEVLRRLYRHPQVSQRALAEDLGVALGTVNFCFQALIEKGLVEIQKFSDSKQKLRCTYLLTPAGIAEKSKLTAEFLRRKVAEYGVLRREIALLKSEIREE